MKITRIDYQTVNCIITEEDMDEQGVCLEDLLTQKDSALEFLKEILSRAAEEVGYHPVGNMTSMQAIVLSDGSISLTISENPASNLRQMLELITERMGVHLPERILKEIGDAPEEERLKRLQDFVANFKDFTEMFKEMIDNQKKQKNGKGAQLKKNKRQVLFDDAKRLLFHEYVFSFDTMYEVIRYAKRIPESVKAGSALYRDAQNKYCLVLSLNREEELVFASMFTIAYEYGAYVTTNSREILHMKEHMDVVIAEDALSKLRQVSL